MKIFNIQPIKVTGYIFNEEHLAKSSTDFSHESGFGYTGKKIESLNTLIITFNVLYYAGKDDDLLLSYDSHCQFNFESEGLDADILSIATFLNEYYVHTEIFFQQYGFKTIQEIEEKIGVVRGLESSALSAIDSLRANNIYEF